MIWLHEVSFSYPHTPVLTNFSLRVEDGKCVCLFGPSGCGKTTVTRLILGLEKADKGEIIAPEKISCVFQEDRLLPHLNVWENVCLPLQKEQYEHARLILEQIGLKDVMKARLSSISGGMRRRVALARAIAYGGQAPLLDEPFNGIDAANKEILAEIIKREYIEKNCPVVLVSHLPQDAHLLNAEIIHL